MAITRRLLHYLQSLQPGDPVCLHALGSWQEGTISDVSDEDVALIQEDRLLYLPFETICAYQVPRRDPAALLCEPFAEPKTQPLSVKAALELALAQSDTAFTAEVRAFASRWESATPDQLHDLCASVVNRIAIPFAHLPQAHTLYAAVWREGKPGRDLRETIATQYLMGGQYESALALGPTDPVDAAALGLMTLETGAESALAVHALAGAGGDGCAWLARYAQGKPAQSAQWLFGAGVYLARQADLPLPELSSPDAAEQLWQTLTVAGDPTYLPQQADPLRLQCPPAPVAAGSKPAAPQYYTGRITYYSAFKHLGYLKRDDGDEKGTFFHYNQVNDPLLRQLLELGQGVDQEVRCRLGMRSTPTGLRDQADDVCLLKENVELHDPRVSGVLCYFLAQGTPPYGRIRDESGREYKFVVSDLLDPSLLPELENSFTTRFDLPVTFLPQIRQGMRLHTARKVCRAQALTESELAQLGVAPAAMEAMTAQLEQDRPDPAAEMTSPYEPLDVYDPAQAQQPSQPTRLPHALFAPAPDEDVPF